MSNVVNSDVISLGIGGSDTYNSAIESSASKNCVSWCLQASGQVAFTPVIGGLASHESYTATDQTIWVDIANVEAWTVTESGGASASARIAGFV